MRRILALGVAALAVFAGLSACTVGGTTDSGGGGGGGGKKEITFLTFETPNLTPQYWDAAIKRITDKYPDITVKKLVSPTEHRTSNGAIDGKVYQLPANTQTIPIVYYNKDLFTKGDIAAPPATYAELLDDAAKLKAKGITPFVVGGVHDALGPTWSAILATELYAKNPNWMHDRRAGKVKFSDPDFKRGAAKLAELARRGYIDKRDVSRDYAATQQAFLDGKGAMYAMGNWFAAAVDDPKTKPSWQVGQFEWPSDDGKLVVPAFTGGGLLVSAKAKNLDAAKRFALAFQLDRTNLDNSTKTDGLYPAIKGYAPPADTGAAFKQGYELFRQGAAAHAVVPAFGFEAGDDGMLPGVVEKWDSSAVDLITGKKTPDQVSAFLDSEWDKSS